MNNNGRKISSKYLLILIFTALFFSVTLNSPANYLSFARFCKILTTRSNGTGPAAVGGSVDQAGPVSGASAGPAADTVKPRTADTVKPRNRMGADSILPYAVLPPRASLIAPKDSVLRAADSMLASKRVDTPDYVISKDTLAANIDYKASDSIVMVIPTHNITLYNKAETKYQDATMTADHIVFDQNRNVVVAHPGVDTGGKPMGVPKIVQTDNTLTADS